MEIFVLIMSVLKGVIIVYQEGGCLFGGLGAKYLGWSERGPFFSKGQGGKLLFIVAGREIVKHQSNKYHAPVKQVPSSYQEAPCR